MIGLAEKGRVDKLDIYLVRPVEVERRIRGPARLADEPHLTCSPLSPDNNRGRIDEGIRDSCVFTPGADGGVWPFGLRLGLAVFDVRHITEGNSLPTRWHLEIRRHDHISNPRPRSTDASLLSVAARSSSASLSKTTASSRGSTSSAPSTWT